MKKREGLLLGRLFEKLAPKVGATVVLEPKWKVAGQVTYKNGVRRYFRSTAVDLNTLGASKIASDKDYAALFMRKLGYPVVTGKAFFRDDFADVLGETKRGKKEAFAYAKKLGFPVIVKPNSKCQGTGIFAVHSKRELDRALAHVFKLDRIALVQRKITGRDYRIVVLDGKVISAYERIPLSVVGDGRSTIRQLLEKKARQFRREQRDTKIRIEDERLAHKLALQKLSLRSVPKSGQRIFLLDNANLSTGGDSVDVTKSMHRTFKDMAIRLTKDMGLRFSGVDIMVQGPVDAPARRYSVLEINDMPGLDHYASSGAAQQKIVEDLYLQVLKVMGR